MKMFQDSKGRTWELSLSLAAAQRIEGCDFSDLTDQEISILNIHEVDCLDTVVRNAPVIFACIYCCIKPQADAQGVTQDEFAESIDGNAVIEGKEAWVEELAAFFPELRTVLLQMLETQKQGLEKIQKRSKKMAKKMVDKIGTDLDSQLDKAEREAEKTLLSGETFG